jgi:SAM-dependent methyltransferase
MTFSPHWLALREPADRAARAPALARALADWANALPHAPLIVDLGCGTGASFRALAPLMPRARWRLVDHDPDLLAIAHARTGAETRCLDLAATPEDAVAGADIVTASALFDLASVDWIARLVAGLPAGAAVLGALSYDGAEAWDPPHAAEPEGLAAFHAHQQGDKGFGMSLGPAGGTALAKALAASGRRVTTTNSPWRLTRPRDAALIEALAEGAAAAARDTGRMAPDLWAQWAAARRMAQSVMIGHNDVLGLPDG